MKQQYIRALFAVCILLSATAPLFAEGYGVSVCGGVSKTCCGGCNYCYCCDGPGCTNGGNCVWYAWNRRCGAGEYLPWCTDAKTWNNYAVSNGWPVCSQPKVGAVGVHEGGTWGHVGYVIGVSGNTVYTAEQGCSYCGTTSSVARDKSYWDGGFIYLRNDSCNAPTPTFTRTATRTATSPPTKTPTRTKTPTKTLTPYYTNTITSTRTATFTKTVTNTRTPSQTRTVTSTRTPTVTRTATETPTITATRTFTPTRIPSNTRTPTPSRTGSPSRTPTPDPLESPTWSPFTSTPSPEVTDTPVPSPTMHFPRLGITVFTNQRLYRANDLFILNLYIANHGPHNVDVNVYILLEVFGTYFFYPSWTENVEYIPARIPFPKEIETQLMNFTWPAGVAPINDMCFWGALVDPDTGELVGEYSMWDFGCQ